MGIRTSALIGLGAVGTVYGRRLHEAYGPSFAVIAGGERGAALRSRGAFLNGQAFYPRVVSPAQAEFQPDLLLVAVKNYQLSEAMEDIAPLVGENTVLLPLLNGITARDKLLERFPRNRVFYGYSIFIDAIRTADGVFNTADGIVRFGDAENTAPAPEVLAAREYLEAAGIKTEVCADMVAAVWKKWMLNLGCNQVSAVTGARYGELMHIEDNRILFHLAMMEAIALAGASGIALSEDDALAFENTMLTFSPESKTSMLQDIEAGRRTEADYFGGTAVLLGERLGVPTPVNLVLYHAVKAREAASRAGAQAGQP
jgi:2-dehydropantoate 2-reductase